MRTARGAGSCLLLAASVGLLLGCASNTQVKLASKEMKDALVSIGAAETDFKKALLAEIDATRDQVERAIIARAVRARVDVIAAARESSGDLLGLSDEIDATSTAAHSFVFAMKAVDVDAETKDADLGGVLDAALKKKQSSIEIVLKLPQLSAAEKADLQRQHDLIGAWASPGSAGHQDLVTLLQLARTRAFVDKRLLAQLDAHIRMLKEVHNAVDGWVQTDVTVNGSDVAKIVEAAKGQLATPGATGTVVAQ